MSNVLLNKIFRTVLVTWLLVSPLGFAQPRECTALTDPLKRAVCLIAKSRANDPPRHSEADLVIGDREILFAVQIWIKGGGEVVVDDEAILAAIGLWVRGALWTSLP